MRKPSVVETTPFGDCMKSTRKNAAAADSAAQRADAAVGGSPRLLTGGEEKPRKAKVDWMNVTWLLNEKAEIVAETSRKFMAEEVGAWLKVWLRCPVSHEYGQGIHGFSNSVRFYGLKDGEVQLVAIAAWGGVNQRNRAYLELTGTACAVVKDWKLVHFTVSKLNDVKVTRLDLAVDFFEGEYTPVQARDDFGSGKFQFSRRMAPKCQEVGDWTYHTGEGRTFYVGKRTNGKQARIYEKGKQLGCPVDPWTRFEVELHNRDRDIPLDALLDCNTYFAGCFPICQELLGIEGEKILTYQEEFCITLDRLIDYCKLSYGKLVRVMRRAGYPVEEIIRLIESEGVPARLAKADWQLSTGRPDSPTPLGA
jgi:phage replication initiation protein